MTPTIIEERLAKLDTLDIHSGAHKMRDGEPVGCVMELASWVAGEPWSDHPQCASPVITNFMIRWNDRLPSNEERNRLLKPLLAVVVNTRSTPEVEQRRREMLRDWAYQTALPKYLEAAKMHDAAVEVAEHPGDLKVLRKVSDEAWEKRRDWRAKLKAKAAEAVKAKLAEKPAADAVADAAAVAVAAAVAEAVAEAVAVAVAAAVADAVAEAVAVAVAAAVAAAVAEADADAVAAAVAEADADADADAAAALKYGTSRYWAIRDAVYKAVRAKYDEIVRTDERFAFVPELQASAQQLVRDMCALGGAES